MELKLAMIFWYTEHQKIIAELKNSNKLYRAEQFLTWYYGKELFWHTER